MTDLVVTAEDLRMVYGRGAAAVCALNGVSIEVRRGEVLLIVGPSGSGKTTLLQIIGALIRPTSGSVRIGGKPIEGLSPKALGRLRLDFFGFVFQAYNLIPELNGWENVAVALDLKGIRGRVAERGSRALSRSLVGNRTASVALARCSALFTDASLLSSISATSADR